MLCRELHSRLLVPPPLLRPAEQLGRAVEDGAALERTPTRRREMRAAISTSTGCARPRLVFVLAVLLPIVAHLAVATLAAAEQDTEADGQAASQTASNSKRYQCHYVHPFAKARECREYRGYELHEVQALCGKVFTGVAGDLSEGECTEAGTIGTCGVEYEGGKKQLLTRCYEGDAALYAVMCKKFLNGVWVYGKGGTPPPTRPAETDLGDAAVEGMTSDAFVSVTPEDCFTSDCVSTLLEEDGFIAFTPRHASRPEPTACLVFYGGADIDPRKYSPIMKRIAFEANVIVAITPFVGNIALANPEAADAVVAAYPNISRFFLSGHSLGGVAVAKYAMNNRDRLAGTIFFAAHPPEEINMHDMDLPTLSIWATRDAYNGVLYSTNMHATHLLYPKAHVEEAIVGGNHAQYGDYGFQEGDFKASMPAEHQYDLIAAAASKFVLDTDYQSKIQHRDLARAYNAPTADEWCVRAQQIVLRSDDADLRAAINVTMFEAIEDFGASKANVTADTIEIYGQAIGSTRMPGHEALPVLFMGEVACKVKSRRAVALALRRTVPGVRLDDDNGSCRDVNMAAFEWAKKALGVTKTPKVSFGADRQMPTGIDWLQSTLEMHVDPLTGDAHIVSPAIAVDDDETFDMLFRNLRYCKLWTPEAALHYLLDYAVLKKLEPQCERGATHGQCTWMSSRNASVLDVCPPGTAEFAPCSRPYESGLWDWVGLVDKYCCSIDVSVVPAESCAEAMERGCVVQDSYVPYRGCGHLGTARELYGYAEVPQCTEPTMIVPLKHEMCCPADVVASFRETVDVGGGFPGCLAVDPL